MNSRGNTHKVEDSKGSEYEKLALMLLGKRGYELSKGAKPQFHDFAIGREITIGDDSKLGDIVFRYESTRNNLTDQNTATNFNSQNAKKNLIFLQIKHNKDDSLAINSSNLTGSKPNNLSRDFNLRKYFTSYCKVKEAVARGTASKELENGEIKYVVLFTNIDLDRNDLNDQAKGFSVQEAPGDIEKLFTLKKSSSRQVDNYKHCYQLATVSDELRNIFKKCSDLHRLARNLAQYVVKDTYKNYFMETDRDPIKQYHVALGNEVIEKTNEQYYFARFSDKFINNDTTGPIKELKQALINAIKEKDENMTDGDLKKRLKEVQWNITPSFGQTNLPKKWKEENASELSEVAEELAKYVTLESHRKNNIFGTEETVTKRYEVAFQEKVIEITRVARFKDDFIDNAKTGANNELLIAVLEAIRKIDESKSKATDEELTEILRRAEWTISPEFGRNENKVECFPKNWKEKNSFDFNAVTTELAKCVTSKIDNKTNIFGERKIIKKYEIALQREILETACVARFKDSFIESDKTEVNKELLNAIMEAIKKLDLSKSKATDEELKEILNAAKWKIILGFGENKLPEKWKEENASELSEVAEELAKYVTSDSHRENNIFGTGENPIKKYEAVFQREIIKIACAAHFRDDFIENDKTGAKKELLNAILTTIRELEPSKSNASDEELKEILKQAELKVVINFGESENGIIGLPCQWMEIKDDDITDFLKCLVFSVKQPNVTDIKNQISAPIESFLRGTPFGKVLDNSNKKFRDRVEKTLGIYKERPRDEKWIAGEEIKNFVEELQDALYVSCWTERYEDEIRKYGDFSTLGELEVILDSYFKEKQLKNKNCKTQPKMLCICTTRTLWSSIKILQYLNAKKSGEVCKQIFVKVDDLKNERFKHQIENAFRSEICNLLTIEYTGEVTEQTLALYYRLAKMMIDNPNKRIIIIIKKNDLKDLVQKIRKDLNRLPTERNYLPDYLRNQYFDPDKFFDQKDDDIFVRDFKPKGNPFTKEMIFFQGQKDKISLEKVTGITDWDSYKVDSSLNGIQNEGGMLDAITHAFDNEQIIVGSRPLGTDSLNCSYASLPEEIKEINKENLTKKLLQQGSDSNANVIYIISGITGSNKDKKMKKMFNYLKLINKKKMIEKQLGDIGGNSRIQISDDQFKFEDFNDVCHKHNDKQIVWIYITDEGELIQKNPPRTSSSAVAHASASEKINKESLTNKLLQQGPDSNANVIYIISGISGSNGDKKEKLIQYLDLINEQEEIKSYSGEICSDSKIQITDDQFKEESFKDICQEHSEKEIFWIYTEHENTFKLQKLFNPNLYLKRKFKVSMEDGIIYWLKLEDEQLKWYISHYSLDYWQKYLDCEQSENFPIEEDELIKEIKDRKIVIISGDPGMGKYTSMTKLYESKHLSKSFLETHWIIRINLREKMSAIKNVNLGKEITDIVNFLSKVDSKLDNDLAKSLLQLTLSKRRTTKIPLILILDGFDEILDGDEREKVISLLEILKEETAAKVWITTLPLYKETLENKLVTFAIELDPMNHELYIEQFFKGRLQLILNKGKFDEIFDEKQENRIIPRYSKAFLRKMESFFFEDASRFIGIPLHLYLMLNDSVNSFKYWVENDMEEDPNFNYLGGNIREVYENFINKKFDIYFKKVDRRGLEETRYNFDECNERLAMCLVLKIGRRSEKFLEIHKDKSSLAGIIKYCGSNVDFIVTSFRDFFCAKSFMDWIQCVSKGVYPGINKECYQNYLIEILRKPDFKLIRSFLNLELGSCFHLYNDIENVFEERLKNGKIAEALFTTEGKTLLIEEKGTVLHIAVEEDNRYIVRFLLDSFKEHRDVLKQFLFAQDKNGIIAAILAYKTNAETVELFYEAAQGISQETFLKLRRLLEDNQYNELSNYI